MKKSVSQKYAVASYAVASACVLLAACGGGSESSSAVSSGTKLAPAMVVGGKAVFSGARANYTIAKNANGYAVIDNAGSDGTTNLDNAAQRMQFTDVSVNPTVAAQAQGIAATDLKKLIELYVAFFNRVPESDGLVFWIERFKAGQGIDQIAEEFYNAAILYPTLTGYSVGMSAAEFVRIIYRNVLGRSGATAPPEQDVQFWADRVASGSATRGTLVRSMLDSAHTFQNDPTWGWVPSLLNNKYTVGHYFAVEQGLSYNTPEVSIERTMEIAAAVTSQDTANAIGRIPVAAGSPPVDPSGPQALPPSSPSPAPTPYSGQAPLSAALVNAPADGAGVSGAVRLEVRGTGIENVELLPPSGYAPLIARFNVSADKTYAWIDLDTAGMPNGTMVSRIVAFSAASGQGGTETVVMPARTWTLNNVPQPRLNGPIPSASYRPQVLLTLDDLPYVDPQPLVAMMQLDETSYRQMLANEAERVRQTMVTYIPNHVALYPAPMGFTGPWYSCVGTPSYVACRDSMNSMIAIMNSRVR
ncbi:DUF4214 domain-containing protein [Noviherbaspirillum saxi]|uniref:DUF4214 domain-containing protein n=1 Tax=Noviherbaspirillum saxi TaxID=2320863 RepID=A0A3A3FMS8_9BURK|nr:DUF4214 domain-containing protein [Noviherbaspirillum saxi]RJF97306.1 DUF4214 domain-containing protein [Noviherbaspirillum saxi]